MIYKEKILQVIDPVCGMVIQPDLAEYHTVAGDEEYYFCSGECLNLFEYDYARYVQDADIDDR